MIESAIITALKNDAQLAALVSVFEDEPAIFSNVAPESKKHPYLVVRVSVSPVDLVIATFDLYIDYFDRGESRVNARKAAECVEFILDNAILEHKRYANCRIRYYSGGFVEGDDPLEIHYNQLFIGRAGRKKFTEEVLA